MKTGNTRLGLVDVVDEKIASMEPGHEDREYQQVRRRHAHPRPASMEPGHEDREYRLPPSRRPAAGEASMEPGHEDREYVPTATTAVS